MAGDDPEEAWNRSYSAVAAAAQALTAIASEGGAAVWPEATLADLAAASRRATVVILLAHFRGFYFSEADLLVPHDRIAARIHERKYPVLEYFDPAPGEAHLLVDALNDAIMGRRLLRYLPGSMETAGRNSGVLGRVLCRDLVDEALDGFVQPGNCVELFDGLHTPGEVEGALYEEFRGEFDLALCNSAALATLIDLRRNGRVHHLHWPDLIHPIPQLVLIGEALRRIERNGGSYIQARLNLERQVKQIDWGKK